MNKYADIINLSHYVSSKRKQMSLENRAFQFMAFRALSGYEEAIKEQNRLIASKIELDETRKEILNNKLQLLNKKINTKPKIKVTYFVKDEKKSDGIYKNIEVNLKKIDTYNKLIILEDKTKIFFEDIYDIEFDNSI